MCWYHLGDGLEAHSNSEYRFSSGVMNVDGSGEVSMSRTEMYSFILEDSPLISCTSKGYVSMNGSRITKIKRETGNGGVVEFGWMGEVRERVSEVTFCEWSAENGGAISFRLNSSSQRVELCMIVFKLCVGREKEGGVYIDGGAYISTSTLGFSKLKFESCESGSGGN